jgi:hypothetical protein
MEVLSPEKWKYYPRKNGSTIPRKIKKGKIGPALERSPAISAISADGFSGNSTSKMRCGDGGRFFREQYFQNAVRRRFFSGNSTSKMRCGNVFFLGTVLPKCAAATFFFREQYFQNALRRRFFFREQYFQNALRESGRSLSRYN